MGDYYKVPVYTNAKIFDEAKLFCDWYVAANKKGKDIKKINLQLKKIIKSLIKKIIIAIFLSRFSFWLKIKKKKIQKK